MARSELVEVSVPYVGEETGWELRVFPWEYVLSAATKRFRGDRDLTVIRHLDTKAARVRRTPKRLTILESAPGELREYFSFDAESKLLEASFPSFQTARIVDPTYDELAEGIKKHSPDVLHVTAIDAHLGATLLEREAVEAVVETRASDGVWDGLLLRGGRPGMIHVGAEQLAQAFNAASRKPRLVGFNCWNSAARIAALTVAQGAQAAVGFQTTFDDSLAELFFSNLYHAWCRVQWDPLIAFIQALDSIRKYPGNLKGTGIVLWSAHSLVGYTPAGVKRRRSARQRSESLKKTLGRAKQRALQPADVEGGVRRLVDVDVKPISELNYSLLHNNRGLFDTFTLRKSATGCLRDLLVEVRLCVGADSFPYQASIDLIEPVTDLTSRIRIPLTSELARTVDENLQTSVFVDIRCGEENIYRETHRVTLMPIDQWRDDDTDRRWLPSFAMPRDPAVAEIIRSAQRYLMCLADDPGAGFDGYQCVDRELEDPWAGVDAQVQALWAALTLDSPIHYINPPPTYRLGSQRLRTPSQVVTGGRGTCIDLTLLLVACLEYIEVYPVIFLLEGHAFPSYWRSEDGYSEFLELKTTPPESSGPATSGLQLGSDGEPWIMGPETYTEVTQHVIDESLVPLESVWLTQRSSFWEAIEEGKTNLRSKRDFHSMFDILLARQSGVTPIPAR